MSQLRCICENPEEVLFYGALWTCTECGDQQHAMCVATGVVYDAFISGFQYKCPNCDPEAHEAAFRRRRMIERAECKGRIYQQCSPYMWQAYCDLRVFRTPPQAVVAATTVNPFSLPTQVEPVSFKAGWQRGLAAILSRCTDAEAADLSRSIAGIAVIHFRVCYEPLHGSLPSILQRSGLASTSGLLYRR